MNRTPGMKRRVPFSEQSTNEPKRQKLEPKTDRRQQNSPSFFCGWNPSSAVTGVISSLVDLGKRRLENARNRNDIESCLRAIDCHRHGPFWNEARASEGFWLLLHQIHLKLGDKEKARQTLKEGAALLNTKSLRDALAELNNHKHFLIPSLPQPKNRRIHMSNLNCSISPVKRNSLRRRSSDSAGSISNCLSHLDSSIESNPRDSFSSDLCDKVTLNKKKPYLSVTTRQRKRIRLSC